MGVLSSAVEKIDTSKQQVNDIQETLDLMVELAKSKALECRDQIEAGLNDGRILGKGDSAKSLYYPISSVKDSRVEYRCITKDTPDDLIDTIGEAISGMIDHHTAGDIVKGVAGVINASLKPLLGLSEGMEQYCSSTSTFVEGSGLAMSIVRFDCIIWGRAVSAESIKTEIQKIMTCVAYKSVVNVRSISFDDFRAVYSPIADLSGVTDIEQALQAAQRIYQMLGGGTELPKKNTLNSNGNSNLTFARRAANLMDARANSKLLHTNGPQNLSWHTRTPLTVQELISQSNAIAATDGKF